MSRRKGRRLFRRFLKNMESSTKKVLKPWPLGWKAKIGVLIPSVDTGYCSYEFRVLCPDGVVTLESRVAMGKLTLENLQKMRGDALYGAKLLASAGPDVITYEATAAGFVLGVEGDAALIKEIEETTGVRATTGSSSVAESLAYLGVKKVSVYAATAQEITQYTVKYLTDKGFDVPRHESVSFSHATEGFRMSPWEVYGNVVKFYRSCPDVDAIFIAGGCFRTLEMLAQLEKDLGLPVVTTVPANMWNCLKIAGIKEPITGFGRLLEGPP
jgi:maleate isomerase